MRQESKPSHLDDIWSTHLEVGDEEPAMSNSRVQRDTVGGIENVHTRVFDRGCVLSAHGAANGRCRNTCAAAADASDELRQSATISMIERRSHDFPGLA